MVVVDVDAAEEDDDVVTTVAVGTVQKYQFELFFKQQFRLRYCPESYSYSLDVTAVFTSVYYLL